MLLRDEKGDRITEDSWRKIDLLLLHAWQLSTRLLKNKQTMFFHYFTALIMIDTAIIAWIRNAIVLIQFVETKRFILLSS